MDKNYSNQDPNNEIVKHCEQREIRYQRGKINGLSLFQKQHHMVTVPTLRETFKLWKKNHFLKNNLFIDLRERENVYAGGEG